MAQHWNDKDVTAKARGGAALETASGEMWLQRGTTIYRNRHNDQGRMLAGQTIDIGGQALDMFLKADAKLNALQEYNKKNNIDAPEIQKSRNYVQKQIDKVYGQHDIPAAVKELKRAYKSADAKFVISLEDGLSKKLANDAKALDKMADDDPRRTVGAKLARDIAVMNLALAQMKAESSHDGEGGAIVFTKACKALRAAQVLDPRNKDLQALVDMVDTTFDQVNDARKRQGGSIIKNPFRVGQ